MISACFLYCLSSGLVMVKLTEKTLRPEPNDKGPDGSHKILLFFFASQLKMHLKVVGAVFQIFLQPGEPGDREQQGRKGCE